MVKSSQRPAPKPGAASSARHQSVGRAFSEDQRGPYESVGRRFRKKRVEIGYSLSDVVELIKDNSGQFLSPAQLSRIENGITIPDVREAGLLCEVLRMDFASLWGQEEPLFVVRRGAAKEVLDAEKDAQRHGQSLIERRGGEHKEYLDSGAYYYAPLVPRLSRNGEHTNFSAPLQMQQYFFEISTNCPVKFTDPAVRENQSHPGEEIVFIVDGDVDFTYQLPDSYRRNANDRDLTLLNEPATIRVNAGDTLQYSSEIAHEYRAIGGPAHALFVFLPKGSSRQQITVTSDKGRKKE